MATISVLIGVSEPLLAEGIANVVSRSDVQLVAKVLQKGDLLPTADHYKPDVVLAEYSLLEPNPLELIRRIKADCPETSVIILGPKGNASRTLGCFNAGASGYLIMQTSGQEILNAIGCVHAGGASVSLPCLSDIAQLYGQILGDYAHLNLKTVLGERTYKVLLMASRGLTNKQISHALSISPRTVQSHFRTIFNKLNVVSRTEAVAAAWRSGLISTDDYAD